MSGYLKQVLQPTVFRNRGEPCFPAVITKFRFTSHVDVEARIRVLDVECQLAYCYEGLEGTAFSVL